MNQHQLKILSILFGIVWIVTAAACGAREPDTSTQISSSALEPASMRLDEYLEKVDGLYDAMDQFLAANDALSLLLQEPTLDTDAIIVSVEELRLTKAGFMEVAGLVPPTSCADAHAALTSACAEFAVRIDAYCDYIREEFLAEEPPDEETEDVELAEIETRIAEAAEALWEAIQAIEALGE